MFQTKKYSAIIILISVFGLAGQILWTPPARAIGQISEPIVIKSAMRGQSATAVLTILNSESKEIKVDLKAEGQIANWTSFYEISDKKMTNPVTQISLPIKAYKDAAVKFEIPQDAPNGVYTGLIGVATVAETSGSETESKSNVSQRIDRQVSITVSDKEVIALNVSVIPSSYDLAAGDPLKIRIIYDNQGNVAVKPDAQLKISRDGQSIYNVIFPYPENAEAVRPGQIKELPAPIEWTTTSQANGQYRAEIKILVNDQTAKEEGFGFSLGMIKISAGGLLAAVTSIGRGNTALGWVFVGGFLLLIAIFAFFLGKKIKRSRANETAL
jgi:uncharacterized membrane protein